MQTLYVYLPANKRLVWYLAAEEYYAKHIHELLQNYGIDKGELLFTWIVPPTVILGRHQVMENEVNIPFCIENNIAMYRRKSGGGCVYADEGNLMISSISTSVHSEQVFQDYLDRMSDCLRALGYEAVKSTHNDIIIGEHKVSGNACFALPTATIVHGTMLFDVNFDTLQQAITPSKEKLAKHGVESVRQRVVNLKSIANICELVSIEQLAQKIRLFLCNQTYTPTAEDLLAIEKIEQEYLDSSFIFRL
jgi:lipoic acid synthetase/lipoate-protein ligase A